MEKLLLSLDEARAACGGISRATMYRLIDSGHLERVNVGRRALVTTDSVRAYVASLTGADR